MSPITTHRHGDILVVSSNNPPVNALGHPVREWARQRAGQSKPS